MMKIGMRVAGILVLALMFTVAAFSQTQATTGTIQGRVEDQQGAVIQGATVEARNTETNFSKQQQTDGDGRFVLLALPPGRYTVTASGKQGFGTLVQENLDLTVGKAISLALVLRVSSGQERVVVTDTPLIDAVKTESSTTLDQNQVSSTPVLGRKFEDFLTLTPGVSVSQGPDGDVINFNGQRGIFNNISLDGGDFNNGFFGEQMGGQRAAIDIALEAIDQFQVVASGASAEFGRTAGGVVNAVTKSGTNNVHGSLFHFQRMEALTSNTSDGKSLQDFHREQFGGAIGGPIKKDKMFFFGTFEQILSDFTRTNLADSIGTPCSTQTPDFVTDEALVAGSPDCQRLALLNFYQSEFGLDEAQPIKHPLRNSAILAKWDWNVSAANKLSASYNFDYSKNENQTFDVSTYGNSANGTEGPSKIQTLNVNFFTTVSPTQLNELHFTYGRENRPRRANELLPPDTAIGSSLDGEAFAFRFGNPFFLAPNVDELFWRTQIKNSYSIVSGRHNWKFGGEWIHSRNSQVFRGFFQGRYLFSDPIGFLHYASDASLGSGFGPEASLCDDGNWGTMGDPGCSFSPLLLYLQGAALDGPATDATGFSDIANEDLALFIQDKWQITPRFTLSYGLRWDAQTFPDPVVPPEDTVYGSLLSDPAFPSDGTLPSQWKQFQPRLGLAYDLTGKGKSVWRATAGIYNAHQNMLSQVGSITTNGVQQQTLAGGSFGNRPTYPGVLPVTPLPPGEFPFGAGIRVFDRNYKNPRIYTFNTQFEQELIKNVSAYVDFTWSKGVYLTNFVNWNRTRFDGLPDRGLFPSIGEMMVTGSNSHSDYKGVTFGARKRFSQNFQMEANYVYAKDYDNDSNERDPFNDFSGPVLFDPITLESECSTSNLGGCFPYYLDWAPSNRDIRHKFNLILSGGMPWGFDGNLRIQARTAQPNAAPRTDTTPRNTGRKDNAYSSVDWRLSRPIRFGERYRLIPIFEMFNTFNSKNNVNTLSAPPLFDFNGFLRVGVGDPRTAQLAVKFEF